MPPRDQRQPDYYLPVTIESKGGPADGKKGIIFKNIPCKIFLPQEVHQQVWAHLELSDGQAEVIGRFAHLFWKMSLSGWLREGGTLLQIEAKECYIPNGTWPSRRYGCSFQRIALPLEVLDLQAVDVHQIGTEDITNKGFGKGITARKPRRLPAPEKEALVTFWLTDNRDLKTFGFEEHSYDGTITIESGDPLRFELLPGVQITFDRHFDWLRW